jgi:predicted negative regulator of RcsB-dependent stress response
MSAHELTRKDLKAPDKFQTAATQAASWAAGRKAQLLAALAAVLVLLVAIAGFASWRAAKGREAGSLLSQTLAAAAADVSSVPLPGQTAGRFESDAERQKAVAQRAQALRQEFPSSQAAVTAALAEADARFRLGEWDAALAGYQAFLDRATQDDPLRFAALDGVARVQESKGQLAEAAQTWERAGEVKAFADRAALERARVLARAGQADEAKKLLVDFPERFKESPLRAEAAERLAKLGR